MTENEAKRFLKIEKECINRNCDRNCAQCDIVQKVEDLNSAYDTAIKALEEVQKYRQIGTVEECRTAVEKQTAIDPEKVAEQIEDIKTGANTNCRMDCSNYDWSTGSCQGLCEKYLKKRAIEIVKAGGTDDKK